MVTYVRNSLQQVWAAYLDGSDRQTLQKLLKAFQGVQALPYTDPNSYYILGGWHGEPFRGPGAMNGAEPWWWGGYCNHGNVLFPTWHRGYLLRLEAALRSIKGCEDVYIPFWDECMSVNPDHIITDPNQIKPVVIPEILTLPTFKFDGEPTEVANPIYSYKLAKDTSFTKPTSWNPSPGNSRYSKPKGYQTVRFPLSGLVSDDTVSAETKAWNDKFTDPATNTRILNDNVYNWLAGTLVIDKNLPGTDKPNQVPDTFSVYAKYHMCLDAPNYTTFSNTTSAAQWINDSSDPYDREGLVPLEQPHNDIHGAVGGFYQKDVYNNNPAAYQQANGDMGDNETAAFDPIFFFHHSWVDYVFHCYQVKWGLTEKGSLSIVYDYPGTVTDAAGSPVGLPPGSVLDMNTPLIPFRHPTEDRYLTSHDVTSIADLGYSYGPGSLDPYVKAPPAMSSRPKLPSADILTWKRVRGINRANIEGSFVIRTYALSPDRQKEVEIGREMVLSRLNVKGCKNCQTHLEAHASVPVYRGVVDHLVHGIGGSGTGGKAEDVKYEVRVQMHSGTVSKVPVNGGADLKEPVLEDF